MTRRQRHEIRFWVFLIPIYIIVGWILPFSVSPVDTFIINVAGIHMIGLTALVIFVLIHESQTHR